MTELMQKVDSIIQKVEMPERHTFFQLKNFIIGKEYTVQGQLWQIIRELRARKESVESLNLQIEDAVDDLLLMKMQKQDFINCHAVMTHGEAIHDRKQARNVHSLESSIEKLKIKVKYILEEIQYLTGAFDTLSKVQEVKPLDDLAAQKEYWNEKLSEELNLRLLLKNPIDSDFVRTILALDDDAQVKKDMMNILHKVQQNMIEERNRSLTLKKAGIDG